MNPREKYLRDHAEWARRDFETHRIREESVGRWLLMKPGEDGWRSEFWTEIVCTHGDGIYVDGDIDCIVFRYGPKHPLARIAWMASRKNAWDHYFCEKAAIGMGGDCSGILTRFDSDVAAYDLREHLREHREQLAAEDIPSGDGALEDALVELLGLAEGGCHREEMAQALGEAGCDLWELIDHVGIVPSMRMFSAHAALQRLYQLLVERGDYAGAPESSSSA